MKLLQLPVALMPTPDTATELPGPPASYLDVPFPLFPREIHVLGTLHCAVYQSLEILIVLPMLRVAVNVVCFPVG